MNDFSSFKSVLKSDEVLMCNEGQFLTRAAQNNQDF